jgi:putative membrane protein
MWWWHDGFGWWMLFGLILAVIFWAAIIALAVWGIRRLTQTRDSDREPRDKTTALDIARERYARGEITRDEFEQIKKDLS